MCSKLFAFYLSCALGLGEKEESLKEGLKKNRGWEGEEGVREHTVDVS